MKLHNHAVVSLLPIVSLLLVCVYASNLCSSVKIILLNKTCKYHKLIQDQTEESHRLS